MSDAECLSPYLRHAEALRERLDVEMVEAVKEWRSGGMGGAGRPGRGGRGRHSSLHGLPPRHDQLARGLVFIVNTPEILILTCNQKFT